MTPLNLRRIVSGAMRTVKGMGLTANITIARASGSPTSFTCTGVADATEDAPANDGLSPNRPRKWTVAALDCDFVPETGHTLAVGSVTSGVIAVDPIGPQGATTVDNAVSFTIKVTT
jgi:hypothetical protein